VTTGTGPVPRRFTRGLFLVIAIIAAIIAVAPLWWILVSSFRTSTQIFATMSPLSWKTFWPTSPTLANYVNIFASPVTRAVVNSLIVTALTVVAGLVVNSMAAFALSALRVRGQTAVFTIVVLSFMIPFDAVSVPLANLTQQVNLDNTFLALVLPGVGNGLAIFLLRQFFLGIPREFVEAARLDGANSWTIYTRLYLPMSRGALTAAGLILFIFQWQAFIWPLLVTSTPNMTVGAVALGELFGEYTVDWGQVFAAAVLLTVIPTLIVLGFQRYLATSLTQGGSKG
jgi:putative chitobiose transport system permease protein